jgi:NADPH:quinone reductase-like Zn-dependent oxidoreductase
MRAAVIETHGGPEVVKYMKDFPDPQPTADEVVVEVAATALNYHDVFTRNGMPGIKVPMPMIMGIDIAGTVCTLGADVKDFKPGDRVLIDPMVRTVRGGLIGEMRHGGLAELCAVPAAQLLKLPANVSFEAAAALPVAYGTAHRMMVTIGQIKPKERVLILGASGGVGTCCVQLAKLRGAEVIVCASTEDKLERLKALGADHAINYTKVDFAKTVWEMFGKPTRRTYDGGVDVVVNYTGGDTWVKSLRALKRGGRMLTCGATAGYDPAEDIRFIWTFELAIQGSNGWTRDDLKELVGLTRAGRIDPTIDSVLPLDRVNDAFALIEDRKIFGKVIVKP